MAVAANSAQISAKPASSRPRMPTFEIDAAMKSPISSPIYERASLAARPTALRDLGALRALALPFHFSFNRE
jgi:hypothetical protein